MGSGFSLRLSVAKQATLSATMMPPSGVATTYPSAEDRLAGVERRRRRRWSLAEKLRIVAETEQSGAGIAEIARRHEISRGLLWNWRSQV
jgi:AcrR family transcriptional regulator